VHEIRANSHESSEIVKCHLPQIFWTTLWSRSSLTTDGRPLHSSMWTFIRPSLNILHHFQGACGSVVGYRHLWADCLEKMWEPWHLTTLWAFMACCRDSLAFCLYTIVIQFLHSLHFDHKPCIVYHGFLRTHVFSLKKADNSANFTAGGIINHRTHNSLCSDKNKHYVSSYMRVLKAMSHVMLPCMRVLSLAPALVA
jgi:hypothetical protein